MPYGLLFSRRVTNRVPVEYLNKKFNYLIYNKSNFRRDYFRSAVKWSPNAIPQTIMFTDIRKISNNVWKFSWDATTGPYKIFLRGRLLFTVTTSHAILDISGYGTYPPPIEVLDYNMVDTVSQGYNYPAYVILQWAGDSGNVSYSIEKMVIGGTTGGTDGYTWVRQDFVTETGASYYRFDTGLISSEESFRIVPIDKAGNRGTPLLFTIQLINNEDPPNDINIEYSGATDGLVVIGGS